MKSKSLLLILAVVLIWGMNFVFIRIGLNTLPPFALCAGRFVFSALPWVFFLPKPKGSFSNIFGYGLFTFAMQFGFLFSGMRYGLSPGLASLVIQVQVFFSIGLSALVFGERPTLWKLTGALISFLGIGMVAMHTGGETSALGLGLVLGAAFCWSTGNIFSKRVNAEYPLSLVVWGNLIAFPLMMAASLVFDGPEAIGAGLRSSGFATLGSVLYIAYISTHVGYGIWGYLLNKHETAVVAPFTLLIPVVGFLSSAYFFGESLPAWKFGAGAFVIAGITFNLLEAKLKPKSRPASR